MPSLELLIPFFLATAIFACVPGPGMFYAAAQTIARGRRAGWLSAIGFHIGGYLHISAAAFGLAVLLETVPVLYAVVKVAGAAYLIWLGFKLFASPRTLAMSVVATEAKPQRRAVRDSIIVEVLNPKTAIFYLSFLPQFTDASASLPIWGQILVLGTIVNFMFSATDAACVLLSEKMTRGLVASQWVNRLARRIGGGILVALGVNLATSQQ
ncbi:MAG: LysE family translocator [Rhodospirillales bacterium]|jgi:threonine/homoserine/homoserine lactone efflux protein|nr:LysE family translocator [Alphaproteobacteria bacterium]MDP6883617.1 LysE family translocator [Rhodospirillales bacterium]